MRLMLISCQVFCREVAAVVERSRHQVEVEILSKGLHNIGCVGMRERIQAAIDRVPDGYDAIMLGYGLCNNGLAGLYARAVPLVVPRAHDCITVLLGSKERYLDYFERHPQGSWGGPLRWRIRMRLREGSCERPDQAFRRQPLFERVS